MFLGAGGCLSCPCMDLRGYAMIYLPNRKIAAPERACPHNESGSFPARLRMIFMGHIRRICHAPPAMGILQAAPGRAVIAPQRRSKRAPQGSPSDVGGRYESLIMPPRCRRARCAMPGLRTALIARPACPSPPDAGCRGGAPYAAVHAGLCLQYCLFSCARRD